MSTADQAIELFQMGIPVRQIRGMVWLDVAVALTRSGQRPQCNGTTTRVMRVCPFFDSCRDCTFQGCALDKFREVMV